MTHLLQDIQRQPQEWERTVAYLVGDGRDSLRTAAEAIGKARHVYLTGIGSSWHAAFGAGTIFSHAGSPTYMQDAAELLQFASFPAESVILTISRSGLSGEIVNLLAKARESGATVIGITNSEDGVLAREAQISILVPTLRDHAISVNTYSTLPIAAAALACATVGSFEDQLAAALRAAAIETQRRLLWEEGAKSVATALGTGSFRHGPQEMVAEGSRFAMWIDGLRSREQDLSIARDLRHLGASVVLIGQDLSPEAGDLVFQLPVVPAEWQFMIDIVPAQLAAEHMARLLGVDCDSFRVCSYIVKGEYGLIGAAAVGRKSQ
jgi:glutamine---fructose-6-phosphate transaminase (isomerizing)